MSRGCRIGNPAFFCTFGDVTVSLQNLFQTLPCRPKTSQTPPCPRSSPQAEPATAATQAVSGCGRNAALSAHPHGQKASARSIAQIPRTRDWCRNPFKEGPTIKRENAPCPAHLDGFDLPGRNLLGQVGLVNADRKSGHFDRRCQGANIKTVVFLARIRSTGKPTSEISPSPVEDSPDFGSPGVNPSGCTPKRWVLSVGQGPRDRMGSFQSFPTEKAAGFSAFDALARQNALLVVMLDFAHVGAQVGALDQLRVREAPVKTSST